MERAVVLNSDYTFLNMVSWKKAIKLLVKEKAEVVKEGLKTVCNAEGTCQIKIPLILRLVKLVRSVYRNKVPFSRKNVMIRDGHKCQYCGATEQLSIDHIIPASRGGKSTYENCVACCVPCNLKKGNKTPNEIHMYLKKQPTEPTIMEFLRIKMQSLGVDSYLKELGVY